MNTYFTNIPKNWIQKSLPILNPFVPKAPFLYPLKTSENLGFSDASRGLRKSALGTNELNNLEDILNYYHILTLKKLQGK